MRFLDCACLIILMLIIHNIKCEMTEKQLKAATKMIRNVCQPKTKVANDKIEAMHRGEFESDQPLMCYTECILRTGKALKDGKLDVDSLMTQAPNLPANRRQPSIDAANHCKTAARSSEKCEAAFEIYKCLYEYNPENFFLP